ncbi:MAG: hypothetical protein C0604_10325, partial [Clostridiales bacterium]
RARMLIRNHGKGDSPLFHGMSVIRQKYRGQVSDIKQYKQHRRCFPLETAVFVLARSLQYIGA